MANVGVEFDVEMCETYTEVVIKLAATERQCLKDVEQLHAELHEWQRGCRQAELYAEWMKQRVANVLLAADEETKDRLRRESEGLCQ